MTRSLPIDADLPQEPVFGDLKRRIVDATGLAYYGDKDVELASHIAQRLAALEIADCRTYLALLRDPLAGETELDAITASLTIGETFFFRHQEMFDTLRDRVLPDLIGRARSRRQLRIWSAGCATGAEAYSLAIMLRRDFGNELADWDVRIWGTDINRDFLLQAQRGEFGEWSLRSMSDDFKRANFVRRDQNWIIHETFRRSVSFAYHNLVHHPFPPLVCDVTQFDLILCRNVMIYFEPAVIHRLAGQFYDCLAEGGWFAVGPAEPNVAVFRRFQVVNAPGAVVYRKGPRRLASAESRLLTANDSVAPKIRLAETWGTSIADKSAAGAAKPRQATRSAQRLLAESKHSLPTLATARAQLDRGDTEGALASCQRLITADRLNPLAHFYFALAADQRMSTRETEQALRRAIYLDRDFVLAHYHLGLVLKRKSELRAARRSFRNVLALLERLDDSEVFADADGLTVAALRQLTDMHLEAIEHP
jgi:chemotaxis protein methyltransferase CheR